MVWDECEQVHLAVNLWQDLVARVDASGFTVEGPVRSPFWKARLALEGIQRQGMKLQPWRPEEAMVEMREGVLQWQGQRMTLEYLHDIHGLRQNFIVHERPEGNGAFQLVLNINGDLRAEALGLSGLAFTDPAGELRFRYEGLMVWDACGKVLEACIQPLANDPTRLVISVDDLDATYPMTVDPVATSASTVVTQAQAGAQFGFSVRSAGDLNGDGYSDVVVGAPEFSQGQLNEGAVFLYYGGPNGISTTPNVVLEMDQPDSDFGWSVGHAGDVNGDGFSDLIVGAQTWDVSPSDVDMGAAFLYYGSATGIGTTPDLVLGPEAGSVAPQYFGYCVTGAGDLNADGFSEVAIGSNLARYGQFNEGAVWVYPGSVSGLNATARYRLERNQAAAQFGLSVAPAGDINGDGFDDLVVGSHRFDLACANPCDDGAVFIYHGQAGANFLGPRSVLNGTPVLTFNTAGISTQTGWAVAGAGDVNGDGYSDVVIGDWRDNIGAQAQEGVAFVYHGSAIGLSTVPATIIQNNQAGSWLGRSVSSAGDINGDGYADVVVGAVLYNAGISAQGAAYIHLGGPGGISATPFLLIAGGVAGTGLGESVAVAGDVNGDGYSDLILGGPSRNFAWIVHGGTYLFNPVAPAAGTAQPVRTYSGLAGARAGGAVANAGDVNGDGFSDVLVGAPEASNGQALEGLVHLYLGGPGGLGAAPHQTLEMNVANARFGFSVATAGDVNGDGYADVLVGAPESGAGGRAYVFLGSPAGLTSTPLLTLSGAAGARYGHAVSTAGDINSDGYSDILVGAPTGNLVHVFLGASGGPTSTPHAVLNGNLAGSSFGHSVATAGDVNGDGFSDIIIGAPTYSSGQANEGAAYSYAGSDSGLVTTSVWFRESNRANIQFGFSVAGVSDVSGDGFFDCAVGAPFDSNGQAQEGRVYFYRGSSAGLVNSGVYETNRVGANLGYSVAEGGDLDGDGYADVVVGAPGWSNPQSLEGAVVVYRGTPSGMSAAVGNFQIWESNLAGHRSGWSVAGGGDVDGDGYSDAVAGEPTSSSGPVNEGSHAVLHGNWARGIARPTRLYMVDLVSPLATNALDPTDVFFGIGHRARSHMQRKPGRLRWEVVFEGQPYSGSPITNSVSFTAQSAGWTDLGLSGAEIKELVYKEPFRRRYKWRVRVEYPLHRSMDGQRFSRWFYGYASAHGDIGVLPVELLQFDGEAVEQGNLLNWATASENGTDKFLVERSLDAVEFRSVGEVQAVGESAVPVFYEWTDLSAPIGVTYYRLRILDHDATWTYSPAIAITRKAKLMVLPNPVGHSLEWQLDDVRVSTARIVDMTGRLVAAVQVTTGRIENGPLLDLPAGVYVLELSGAEGDVVATSRFVKE